MKSFLLGAIFFVCLWIQDGHADDYTITPLSNSPGLYYEQIGEVSLSNNNWEFVTSINYTGYLMFYEYLHKQAEKLYGFCQKANVPSCFDKLQHINASLGIIAENERITSNFLGITSGRKKRAWQQIVIELAPHILQPLGQGLSNWLFGSKQSMPDMSVYDQQLADLNNGQQEIRNVVEDHITMFKADSEEKAKQIEELERAQRQAQFELKIINETMQRDSQEKEQKINDLQEFLNLTSQDLKQVQEIVQKHSNDIQVIKNFMANMTSFTDYLDKSVKDNKQNIDQNRILIEINSLVSDFDFIFNNFVREQSQLLEIVTKANKGDVDARVITPLRLINLIKEAGGYIPEGSKFPYHPEIQNAMKLYRLIDPVIFRYNYTIVFKLRMKLVQINTLSLYKITSAPMMVEPGKYVFVLPKKPFLMVDKQEREFASMTEENYKSCTILGDTEFICSNVITSTVATASNIGCDAGIFLNKEISSRKCDVRVMYLKDPLFLQLQQERSWLFVVPEPTSIIIKTSNSRLTKTIQDVGIITVGKGGTAVMGNVVLTYSPYKDYTKVLSTYMPDTLITNAVDKSKILDLTDEELQYKPTNPILPFDFEELKEFSVSVSKIQGAVRSGLKEPEKTNHLQYAMISVAVVGVIVLGLFILYKKNLIPYFNRTPESENIENTKYSNVLQHKI